MDDIETRLRAARPTSGYRDLPLTDRAKRELAELMLAERPQSVAASTGQAHSRSRFATRRFVVPVVVIAAAVSGVGVGAAATQWGPWTYVPEADIVIARDWYGADGGYLGGCESRMAVNELPDDAADAARAYLASVDVSSVTPDTEVIAAELNAAGRLDDLPRLVSGADPNAFDLTHEGEPWNPKFDTDARVLQAALVLEVFSGMSEHLAGEWPELATQSLTARAQTQCTTDPLDLPDP